jgi:diphthine-ammonia ligase
MEFFPSLNAIYATFFGTSPPTRACVAVDLPTPMRVKFDCFAYSEMDPAQRTALHVQALSYWAPANIGPYSQAVLVDERIFVSGQIGLIPAGLSLPSPRDPVTEIALAFQHTERVVDAVRKSSGQWKGHIHLAIYWLTEQELAAGVVAAHELSLVVGIIHAVQLTCPHFSPGKERADGIFGSSRFTERCRHRKASFSAYGTLHRSRR